MPEQEVSAPSGFKQFIMRGNVVDLAVGVVIGAAFGKIVDSLVSDVITPLIALIFRQPDFGAIHLGPLMLGKFLNASLSFVIVAATIYYLVVLPMAHVAARFGRKAEPAAPERQ